MNTSQKIRHFFILLIFRLLSLLSLKVLYLISELLTFLIYHVIGYRKKVVYLNLSNSFPDWSDEKVKQIAKKYYRHMSAMMVENVYLRFIRKKDGERRVILENKSLFDELYQKNKNLVVMTGHFGNWEFFNLLPLITDYEELALYKKVSDPVFDQIYIDMRTRFGAKTIEMNEAMRKVIERNKDPKPYFLLMIADQSPADTHHWIKFLNQDTSVFLGSEKIARRFDMAVVYVEILRHKKGVYRFIPTLITENAKNTSEFEITDRYFQLLEESIKRSPRYWLWSHRRWKHKKPDSVKI